MCFYQTGSLYVTKDIASFYEIDNTGYITLRSEHGFEGSGGREELGSEGLKMVALGEDVVNSHRVVIAGEADRRTVHHRAIHQMAMSEVCMSYPKAVHYNFFSSMEIIVWPGF